MIAYSGNGRHDAQPRREPAGDPWRRLGIDVPADDRALAEAAAEIVLQMAAKVRRELDASGPLPDMALVFRPEP